MQAYNQKSLETLVYSIHWVFRTESKSFDRRFSAVQPLRKIGRS